MNLSTERPPKTIMEVYQMLPEGTRCELIDQIICMSPFPLPVHQVVLNEINFQLLHYFKLNRNGMVYLAPFDVYLDSTSNAVQPDLTIVLKDNPNQVVLNKPYEGVPDIVVEILSPSNKDFDLVRKKNLYEKVGIKEYWIVDPETKQVLVYELIKNSFVKKQEAIREIHSELLNHVFLF